MSKINKIQIDNTTYDIEDAALTEVVNGLSMPYSNQGDYGLGTVGKAIQDLENSNDISANSFASVEESTTASKAYAIGDYFWLEGDLYRVTAAIASGGTITVNTNCIAVKLADDLYAQSKRIDAFSNKTSDASLWEQGAISSSNGSNSSSTTRIRTISYLADNVVSVSVNVGYTFAVAAYSKTDNSYVGFWRGSVFNKAGATWFDREINLKALGDYKYRLVVQSGSTIVASEGSNVILSCTTDSTLSVFGVPADAKATGDAVDKLKDAYGNSVSVNLLKYESDDLTALYPPTSTNLRKVTLRKNRIHQEPTLTSINGSTYYAYLISKTPRYISSGNASTIISNLTADDFAPLNISADTQLSVRICIHSVKTATTTTSPSTGLLIIATYNTETETVSNLNLGAATLIGTEKERYVSYERNLSYQLPEILTNQNIAVIYQSRYPCMTEDVDIEFYAQSGVQSWERPIRTSVYNSMTATANHSVNDLLLIRGALYRVIATVANGDDFVVGTNIELTDVCSELATATNAEMLTALYS